MPKRRRRRTDAERFTPKQRADRIKALEFLGDCPVFRLEDFLTAQPLAERSKQAAMWLLEHFCDTGLIFRLRRGVSCLDTVDEGGHISPYLIAKNLLPGAVIGYAAALAWHLDEFLPFPIAMISHRRMEPFTFYECDYFRVKPPVVFRHDHTVDPMVEDVTMAGTTVLITSLERTFIDLLDRPDLAFGGMVPLLRTFTGLEQLDPGALHHYAMALRSRHAIARLAVMVRYHPRMQKYRWGNLFQFAPQHPFHFDPTFTEPGQEMFHRCFVPRGVFDDIYRQQPGHARAFPENTSGFNARLGST